MTTNTACTIYMMPDFTSVIIPAVMWQEAEALSIKKYGAEGTDSAIVLIPKLGIPEFTLKKGDLIIKGAVDFVVDGSNGHRQADLLTRYKALKIMHLSNKCYGSAHMQHFELLAR